jgi:hypothetical protein
LEKQNITIDANTGSFAATLELRVAADEPDGEMSRKNGKGPMLDMQPNENAISWATKVERLMPMKLKFKGIIHG